MAEFIRDKEERANSSVYVLLAGFHFQSRDASFPPLPITAPHHPPATPPSPISPHFPPKVRHTDEEHTFIHHPLLSHHPPLICA